MISKLSKSYVHLKHISEGSHSCFLQICYRICYLIYHSAGVATEHCPTIVFQQMPILFIYLFIFPADHGITPTNCTQSYAKFIMIMSCTLLSPESFLFIYLFLFHSSFLAVRLNSSTVMLCLFSYLINNK